MTMMLRPLGRTWWQRNTGPAREPPPAGGYSSTWAPATPAATVYRLRGRAGGCLSLDTHAFNGTDEKGKGWSGFAGRDRRAPVAYAELVAFEVGHDDSIDDHFAQVLRPGPIPSRRRAWPSPRGRASA